MIQFLKILFTSILLLLLSNTSAISQVAHTEATGSYSGLFFSYESFEKSGGFADEKRGIYRLDQTVSTAILIAMYPGKIFGFGIEAPLITRNIRFFRQNNQTKSSGYREMSDLRFVAKYQFGVYKRYRLFGRDRLLNMLVSLVGKIKFPSASTNIRDRNGTVLAPFLQPGTGSTDMTLGFIFHSGTQKYFRIHGHLTTTFSLSHREYVPGKRIHFTLSYIPVRMGIKNRYYPFLGLKGWWKDEARMDNIPQPNTEGLHLYFSPGFRSTWWYLSGRRVFYMFQAAFQIKLLATRHVMPGPVFGFYIGTRLFFR